MDISMPVKECNLRLNENVHLPENFAEFESISVNKEKDSLETDELEIKRNVSCRQAKRKVVNDFESKKNYKEISSDSESETEVKKNIVKISIDSKDDKGNGFAERKDEPKRELSSYEQMIKKRCQENMAFLQSIKVDEAKASFFEAMGHVKRKKPCRKQQTETEKKPSRKSKRLENCHFEFEERKMMFNAQEAALMKESEEECKKVVLHSPMSFKAAVSTRYESHLKDIEIQELKANDEFCLYNKSVLENMALNKVCYPIIKPTSTVSWYPSSDHLILAAGTKCGNIAIWNVCLQSGPLLMLIHKDVDISHSQFSPYNQANLIFSSLDGTVFCADLIQQTFSKVCSLNESCTYFDFYSASTYLVALNSGEVAIVDKRIDEKTSQMSLHTCSSISIQTLSNHPVNRNFFITAHDNKCKLWDLRKLETEPIAQNYQQESLRSAFFSPNTGNYILATYRQTYLRMFNFSNTDFENCINLRKTLSLNRNANSSVATWLPNSEETFSTRHGGNIKGINFYDTDMQDYTYLPTSFKYYFFGAYSFHPKRPALACSHSAGRISVYLKE